jgi:TolB-like protein/DNA-binding winged helix-turn-helix (wHTH) protein/tetratricopeptide (TPR) repeat protein
MTAGKAFVFRFEDVEVRERELTLIKAGEVVPVEPKAFRVLLFLLHNPQRLITKEELLDAVWADAAVTESSLTRSIAKLRRALGDDFQEPRYIETVATVGYRLVCPVEVSEDSGYGSEPAHASPETEDTAIPATSDSQVAPGSSPKKSSIRKLRWLLLAACLILATSTGLWIRHRRQQADLPIRSLAVLPLDDLSPGTREEYFADGMTDELITELARIPSLRVVSRTSVMQDKGARKPLAQIARELDVDAVLEGSVVRSGDRVRITAQLIDTRSDKHLWAHSFEGPLGDVLSMQDNVAREIASQARTVLTPAVRAELTNEKHIDPEAHDAYLKGRYYWNKRTADGLQKGSIYFQQAIEKDPVFAAAYSGLADCDSGLAWHGFVPPDEAFSKAHAAALKAVELDPQSAEAHASLALVLRQRWDWPGAEAEFKRALQLDPQYANAHHWYGDYLSIKGRHDEALFQARQALELDPLNLMIGTWVALRYYLARKYGLAIEQSQKIVALDPNFAGSHLLLGDSYVQAGLHKQGLAELQLAARLSGGSPLYLAQVAVAQAVAGKQTEALRIGAQLQKTSRERYVSSYGLAQIYAALNNKEQTFKWLQAAHDDHAVWMSYLAVDPVFDRFREDQRFQDLLRRVGLLP